MPSTKLSALIASLLTATTLANAAKQCVGDDYSVHACADVTWSTPQQAQLKLSLADTDGDSHGVYMKYRVYYDGDGGDEEKLENNEGHDKKVTLTVPLDGDGKDVSGVRFWACVSDWGRDTCTGGKFIKYVK
ncbi:hypothetical protein PRZ48_011389 [Zasmidium cellare]|uniref:Uncharacterized protein n=1 Tax=Zasmidium cellare TaxID=395010 RepID=A0ABR0E670_ZASCE|nr:hypothetical protein PRZ48_011389 [Zasmidium cellare]